MDQITAAKLEQLGLNEESFSKHYNELKSAGVDSFRTRIKLDDSGKGMILALLEDYRENDLNLSDGDSYLMLKVFESDKNSYKELYNFMDGRYSKLMDSNIYLMEHKWNPDNDIEHVTEQIHSVSDVKKGTIREFLKFHEKDFSLSVHRDRIQLIKNALLREGFILENELEEILNEIGMRFL